MTYQHIPLTGPRQTRLLLLHPAKHKSSPLSGDLTVYDLSEPSQFHARAPVQYQALSYVWGPPSTMHFISIASLVLPITANCDAALRHLRRTSGGRVLWVDSICIDQTPAGVNERNLQVAMMGEIYQKAHDVVIWLGEGDESTDSLFLHLKRMYTLRGEVWEDTRNAMCTQFYKKCDAKWKRSERAAVQDIIESVLSQPWFERMWTLQELLLSTRATIMCGNGSAGWDTFCQGFELTEASFPLSSKGMINFGNCYYAYSSFKELIETEPNTDDHKGELKSLAAIVSHASLRRATDPKDKVFALYGLSQKMGKPMRKPDYLLSVPEIYTQATIDIMKHDNSLWPLDNTWSENRRHDLPSWVPDWSDDYRWFDDQLSELGGIPLNPTDDKNIPTSCPPFENHSSWFRTSPDPKELKLDGKFIGVIEFASRDQGQTKLQQKVMSATKQTPGYFLAMRKYGAAQIKFFRSIYSEISKNENEFGVRFQALSRLFAIYGCQPFDQNFEAGSRALHFLLQVTDSSKSSLESTSLINISKEKLAKAVDSNQRHDTIFQFLELDLDMALDVLLSPLECGPEYRFGRRIEDPDYKLVGAIAQAGGFYRLIRGLAINNSVFTTASGLVGYGNGRLCKEDVLVKFDTGPSLYVLHPKAPNYRLHSIAVVEWPTNASSEYGRMPSIEFILI